MDAIERIKLDEGFSSGPYRDTRGILTIGYGLNLEDGITLDEADWLLRHRVEKTLTHLRLEPYWVGLDEVRQGVLMNMVYNLGWPRFSLFAKLREALREGDYTRAAAEMKDSAWYGQVGKRSARLVSMMLTGEWAR